MRLSVFEYVTITTGSSVGQALREVVDLAQAAEGWGYHGFWFAEHHLGRGRAGAAPVVLTALTAAATSRLDVGTAVAVLPHYRPLALVEQISTVAELHPGRVHLGIGKGASHPQEPSPARVVSAVDDLADPSAVPAELQIGDHQLLLKELALASDSSRRGYERSVAQVLSLLTRPIATIEGHPLQAAPGLAAPVTPWLFGQTSVESARHSAALGLPYAVNQHVSGHSLDEAVNAYRSEFRPSAFLEEPYLACSVHAVAAPTDAEARRLAEDYPRWIAGVLHRGFSDHIGAPADAALEVLADPERLQDAVGVRVVGEAAEVVDRIRELGDQIDADEIMINTVVADAGAKARSYELIAKLWGR